MIRREGEQNIAIVLSAGRGSRMHTDIPKQYLDLCGMPVIAWSLRAFESFEGVDEIILVSSPADIEYCRSEVVARYGFGKVCCVVAGGQERYLSVWEGLKAAKSLAPQTSYVFIHDGARPLVDEAVLRRSLEDVRKYRACVVGMPVKDTIKVSDEQGFAARTPDRRLLWQIQTPQVFSFPLVYGAYQRLIEEKYQGVTDDAMVVERETGMRVKLTEGSYRNIKITTPEDLEIARLFLL